MDALFISLNKDDQDKVNFVILEIQGTNNCYALLNKAYLGPNPFISERPLASVPPDKFCKNYRNSSIFYSNSTIPSNLAHTGGLGSSN